MNSEELALKRILDYCYSFADNNNDRIRRYNEDFDNETIASNTEFCRKEVEQFSLENEYTTARPPAQPSQEVDQDV